MAMTMTLLTIISDQRFGRWWIFDWWWQRQIAGGREGSQEDGTLLWALHRSLEKVTIFFETKHLVYFFSKFVFTIFVTRVENLMRSRLLQIQKPENWLTMRREKLSFQRSIFKLVCLIWKGLKTWFDHWKVKIGNFSSKRVSDIHSDQKISNYTLSLW